MPQKPRVLFLDDEESIRATLPLMLEAYGFAVTSTGNRSGRPAPNLPGKV